MTTQEAIVKSIEHWQRMISWAEKQEKNDPVNDIKMENGIGEDWLGVFCPLCYKFGNDSGTCLKCPLKKKYGRCSRHNFVNNWGKVSDTKTWAEWVKEAKIMLEQLKSLEGK